MQSKFNGSSGLVMMDPSIFSKSKLEELENRCNEILKSKDIKFVGVINNLGNLIAGGFGDDVEPLGNKDTRKMMYMQLKLDLNMREDYDELYGPVRYVVSKRRDAKKISIPVGNYMILTITQINFDDQKIDEIISLFEPILDSKP